jgi:glutathione S-transferase
LHQRPGNFLNKVLENSFVVGTPKPSIADISWYCELSQMLMENYNFSNYKNLNKWMSYIGNLNGIIEAHKVFNSLLPRIKI